ncbi:hypothetical protein JX265_005485 [Neoarthrinium moseri]|uniref:Uncharacterized protein n=1 Tax=Neoarthrinium moseri TaxID=1658444 RepID=A0A9P9WNU5_9PEZI|nr:hypothetical protein JX265_005485 [Neoarthrinium moseri]
MCGDLKITYGCGHWESQFTECPAFRKKRSSFMAKLFGRSGAKDCGKVRRERSTSTRPCDQCAITGDGLSSQRVGNGARIVHRHYVDESFRNERQDAARSALKSGKKPRSSKSRKHHEVISSKNSVWCPEYYHHPETVAAARYGRPSAPAPPVAPPRAPEKSTKPHSTSHRSSSRKTSSKSTGQDRRLGHPIQSREEAKGYYPAFSPLQPLRRPAEPKPALASRKIRGQGIDGPPPSPYQPYAHEEIGYAHTCDYKHYLPMAGARPAAGAAPPLKARPQPIPAPKPYHQVYSGELKQAERLSRGQSSRVPAPAPQQQKISRPQPPPRKTKPAAGSSVLQSFGRAIGIEGESSDDTNSDISFACAGARLVESRAPQPASRRR